MVKVKVKRIHRHALQASRDTEEAFHTKFGAKVEHIGQAGSWHLGTTGVAM